MNVDFSLLVLRAESQRVAMQKENPSKKRKANVQVVSNTQDKRKK